MAGLKRPFEVSLRFIKGEQMKVFTDPWSKLGMAVFAAVIVIAIIAVVS